MSSSRIRSSFKNHKSTTQSNVAPTPTESATNPGSDFIISGDIKRLTPEAISGFQETLKNHFKREYIDHLGHCFYVCDFQNLVVGSHWAEVREALRYLMIYFSFDNRSSCGAKTARDSELLLINEKAYTKCVLNSLDPYPMYLDSVVPLHILSKAVRAEILSRADTKQQITEAKSANQFNFKLKIKQIIDDLKIDKTSVSENKFKYVQNKEMISFSEYGNKFSIFQYSGTEFELIIGKKDLFSMGFYDWQGLEAKRLSECLKTLLEIAETLDSFR